MVVKYKAPYVDKARLGGPQGPPVCLSTLRRILTSILIPPHAPRPKTPSVFNFALSDSASVRVRSAVRIRTALNMTNLSLQMSQHSSIVQHHVQGVGHMQVSVLGEGSMHYGPKCEFPIIVRHKTV